MSPDDYGAVVGQLIQFNTGDTKQMHIILIEQDNICEIDPFFSSITLVGGVPPIEVIRPQATVIIDDSLKPECGKLWIQILPQAQSTPPPLHTPQPPFIPLRRF